MPAHGCSWQSECALLDAPRFRITLRANIEEDLLHAAPGSTFRNRQGYRNGTHPTGSYREDALADKTYPRNTGSRNLEILRCLREIHQPQRIGVLDPGLRLIKGFDQAGLDLGDRYWNLLVSYDDDARVTEITKNYIDRRIGIFNHSIVESKQ